jgi:carboxyl-terminal processing protease
VTSLVEQVLDTMQYQSFKRDQIDWTGLRSQVLARAAGATKMSDTYPALQLALSLLNDSHSRYVAASGSVISYSSVSCASSIAPVPPLPANIGYVRVGSTSNTTPEAYAGALHSAIRAADSDNTTGWIVDLRGNGGGSTYAMVAGVGPILGDGAAGSFVNLDGVKTEWGYRGGVPAATGATSNGSLVVIPSTVYQLRRSNPRVAVLSDRANASAGESTLISFIGRPDTRVFGTASCGLSTGVAGLTMRDGAVLWLARSFMADRNGRQYGGAVLPDETIADSAQVIPRAVQWLQSGR